ncbi:MAG: LytTR family transcriptional regulator DNA-binding domain-containing protein, partial [Burkholderiaceae bacterium]
MLSTSGEYPIRTPLKELAPRLDLRVFRQVHRGTQVRANAIDSVLRDESGRLTLS